MQSAIRNPPKAIQCRNPPQSAIRPADNAKSLQAFEPGTVRSQEKASNLVPEAPEGCVLCRFSHRFRICSRKRAPM
eukprot:13279225-Alexandrium_andersonii.AAC.1